MCILPSSDDLFLLKNKKAIANKPVDGNSRRNQVFIFVPPPYKNRGEYFGSIKKFEKKNLELMFSLPLKRNYFVYAITLDIAELDTFPFRFDHDEKSFMERVFEFAGNRSILNDVYKRKQ